MEPYDKEEALLNELERVLERHTKEYDLTYPQVLGCIDIIKASVIEQYQEDCLEEE